MQALRAKWSKPSVQRVRLPGAITGPTLPAPLRLTLPGKYGFKSIRRITVTGQRARAPQDLPGNPAVLRVRLVGKRPSEGRPSRWSQATEEVIGDSEGCPTLMFNGYGLSVADPDKDPQHERLWV